MVARIEGGRRGRRERIRSQTLGRSEEKESFIPGCVRGSSEVLQSHYPSFFKLHVLVSLAFSYFFCYLAHWLS